MKRIIKKKQVSKKRGGTLAAKHRMEIDEVSKFIGNLDARAENLEKGQQNMMEVINRIDEHVSKINGSIAKYHEREVVCSEKFKLIEKGFETFDKKLKGIKGVDKKFILAMGTLATIVIAALEVWFHFH
jgi:peptidoglycan hydrolase CwlO-like protein